MVDPKKMSSSVNKMEKNVESPRHMLPSDWSDNDTFRYILFLLLTTPAEKLRRHSCRKPSTALLQKNFVLLTTPYNTHHTKTKT